MPDRLTNDRAGCPRNDDQHPAQSLPSAVFTGQGGDDENETRAAVEMTLLWKSQNDFHRSLEISHRTRDSHIPTSRSSFSYGRRT